MKILLIVILVIVGLFVGLIAVLFIIGTIGSTIQKIVEKTDDSLEIRELCTSKYGSQIEVESGEIIYYESERHPEFHKLLGKEYERLHKHCRKHWWQNFIYLEEFNRKIVENQKYAQDLVEMAVYEFPSYNGPGKTSISYEDIRNIYDIPQEISGPCLIKGETFGGRRVTMIMDLSKADFRTFRRELNTFAKYTCKSYERNYVRACLVKAHEMRRLLKAEEFDERFNVELDAIQEELEGIIRRLKATGLTQLAIQRMVGMIFDKPSRLLVDKDNRILLQDYNNKEIDMSPIQKAVYFLFLNHPEGILLKDIGNYRQELAGIYSALSNRTSQEDIEDSIARLTDPYDNSLNEKCARIKRAFLSEFCDELAQLYYISGHGGKPKLISLPRDIITSESGLVKV